MKLFTYLATSFISSLLFIYLIILYSLGTFAVFELMDLLIALWVFVFPLFLVGGFIVGVIALCFQNFFDFKKYVPALILFIVVGILLNFFALGHWLKNGWGDGTIQYWALGVFGSVLYFHIWLLLNKLAVKIKIYE